MRHINAQQASMLGLALAQKIYHAAFSSVQYACISVRVASTSPWARAAAALALLIADLQQVKHVDSDH